MANRCLFVCRRRSFLFSVRDFFSVSLAQAPLTSPRYQFSHHFPFEINVCICSIYIDKCNITCFRLGLYFLLLAISSNFTLQLITLILIKLWCWSQDCTIICPSYKNLQKIKHYLYFQPLLAVYSCAILYIKNRERDLREKYFVFHSIVMLAVYREVLI